MSRTVLQFAMEPSGSAPVRADAGPTVDDGRPPCDYRDACRCAAPLCLHAAKGPAFGKADGVTWRVTADACRACGGVNRGLGAEAERLLSAAPARPWEDLAWLRRWAAAGRDPAADVRRYAAAPPDPAPQDPPLVGWLHVATIGRWEPILRELLSAVERSGLRAATSRVYAGVVGPEADLSWLPPWVTVVRRDGDLDMGENSTLRALWDWSKTVPPSKVWYLHTKGASRGDNPNVTAWRDYLVYWNVLRWRHAAADLDGPYDCYGVDYATPRDGWFSEVWGPGLPNGSGFVGNVWWARSGYLAGMRDDQVILSRSRWDAEWSFVGAGSPRVFQPHETRLSLYSSLYPRPLYDTGDLP